MSASDYPTPPAELLQGATLEWATAAGDYTSAAGYTASATIRSDRDSLTLSGAASGSSWAFSGTPTQTAGLIPGVYAWQVVASKTGDARVLDAGRMVVAPDISATQIPPFDPRTTDERIHATLSESLANPTYLKTLAGEQIEALGRQRYLLGQKIAAERHNAALKAGGSPTRNILVRFAP